MAHEQTSANWLTVDRLLARLAALEEERARLEREYARLGAQLHAHLGHAGGAPPPAGDRPALPGLALPESPPAHP